MEDLIINCLILDKDNKKNRQPNDGEGMRRSKMYRAKEIRITIEAIKQKFNKMDDYVQRTLRHAEMEAELLFISTITDEEYMRNHIIIPFYEMDDESSFEKYLTGLPENTTYENEQDLVRKVLEGSTLVALSRKLYVMNYPKVEKRGVSEAAVEKIFQGPREAMVESFQTNLNLVRHRYSSPTLKTEIYTIGKKGPVPTALLYDEEEVDHNVLDDVRKRINDIDVNLLQAHGQLQQLLTKRRWSLFPAFVISERPDRVAKSLAEGKIIVLLDKVPDALIIPSVFFDFFSSMDDYYLQPLISRFFLYMRYFAFFVSITLPAFYVGVTAFNPEIFRVQLALSIAGSRIAVPYPAFIEVLFMLFIMEMLVEASLRLPKTVGSTATTVGGLILGQAATAAGLVSNIMIIIVATVAITNFITPINAMGLTLRVVKYPILLLASLFGTLGLVVGLLFLVFYLCHLRSFGRPYFKLFLRDDIDYRASKESPFTGKETSK